LCGIAGDFASCLCNACRADLPFLHHACDRCGLPVTEGNWLCGRCVKSPPIAECTITAFHYRYPLDALIKHFKYKDVIRIATPLSDVLVQKIKARNFLAPEMLIPVPLHRYRLFRRGYNQAVVISRLLGSRLGIRTDATLVKRQRNTAPMFSLGASGRRQNIAGAFVVQRPCPWNSVAIVDDVITSGSTVNELARALRIAGIRHIQLWALARAD
jgi:ComF family protein